MKITRSGRHERISPADEASITSGPPTAPEHARRTSQHSPSVNSVTSWPHFRSALPRITAPPGPSVSGALHAWTKKPVTTAVRPGFSMSASASERYQGRNRVETFLPPLSEAIISPTREKMSMLYPQLLHKGQHFRVKALRRFPGILQRAEGHPAANGAHHYPGSPLQKGLHGKGPHS